MEPAKEPFQVWDCQSLLRVRCPATWDALDETAQPDIRHCPACRKDVHLCRTPDDFVTNAEGGRCVAIPDNLAPGGLSLGEPSPADLLRRKENLDRGTEWWQAVADRLTVLGTVPTDAVRTAREKLSTHADSHAGLYSPDNLAVLRLAARSDGVRCPDCGFENAQDYFGIIILAGTLRCERCQEPIDLAGHAE